MGIELGKSQILVKPVHQFAAAHMLQFLCKLVHFIPAEIQFLRQKKLPKPVTADDMKGDLFSFGTETETIIRLIMKQLLGIEFLHHVRNGSGFGLKAFSQGIGGDRTIVCLQMKNGLQIILFTGCIIQAHLIKILDKSKKISSNGVFNFRMAGFLYFYCKYWRMLKSGFIMIWVVLLLACNGKKKGEESEGFSYEQFSERFATAGLPFQISDTSLQNNKDTAAIRSAEFAKFIPDSLRTKLFGKTAKVRYVSQKQVKVSRETALYIVRASSGNKRASLLLAFDKGEFSAVLPLLVPDADPSTSQWTVIDKGLGITKNISKRAAEAPREGREVYQYDPGSRQFRLVLTNPLDISSGELINPIDTLPRKHKFSGDYGKDKKNLVSIRDGRYPNQLQVFIHLDKNNGDCTGELKGDLLLTSSTTAVYRESGDPCVMSFKFSGNSVVIQEDQGCGAHRGLDCSFDGTFSRKKDTKSKTSKKASTGK